MLKAFGLMVGRFFLRILLKPVVKSVPSLPVVRGMSAAVYRGRHCFRIPRGKILIVVPEVLRPGQTQTSVAPNDETAADEVSKMLEKLGYRRDSDWEIRRSSEVLSDSDRKQNLILVCASNLTFLEILRTHPEVLKSVQYTHSTRREERYFAWQNRRYQWTDTVDYALIAVRRNPFNAHKRLVLLAGLRDIGTLGAARVFANQDYADLRRDVQRDHASHSRDIELLVRVSHPPTRDRINNITVARTEDGESLIGPPRLGPIHNDVRMLNRLYMSLDQHPRLVVLQDFVYEITYTADFGVRIRREYTMGYGDSDVVVYGSGMSTDVPLIRIEDLHFEAKVLSGGGEVVVLAATNEEARKEFLLFPVPPIRQMDTPRRFQDSLTWPQAGRKMRALGGVDRHTCRVSKLVSGLVDRVTIRIASELPSASFEITAAFPAAPGVFPKTMTYGTPFEHVMTGVEPGTMLVFSCERST